MVKLTEEQKRGNTLIVTRGDGVPLPDQAAALAEFKAQCLKANEQRSSFGLVEFVHIHTARRALSLLLAMARHSKPTPFDEEREQAFQALTRALEHPL